jgi:hypothetical protein
MIDEMYLFIVKIVENLLKLKDQIQMDINFYAKFVMVQMSQYEQKNDLKLTIK